MAELAKQAALGGISSTQRAAQEALEFGRNLYVSGCDYSDLYGRVTDVIENMRIGDLALDDGTTMDELADRLDLMSFDIAREAYLSPA